jgi:quercetin dioxygenase-like cupin family protein
MSKSSNRFRPMHDENRNRIASKLFSGEQTIDDCTTHCSVCGQAAGVMPEHNLLTAPPTSCVPSHGGNMIVTSNEATRRTFLGVDFVVLSHGPESMVTKMLYKKGDAPPSHHHPNEQSGYVISGSYRIVIGNAAHTIAPGDSYSIPRDTPHRIEIIEPGEVLDFFSPPRVDYLDGKSGKEPGEGSTAGQSVLC